ncbi:MAG: LamG-like jellyroll fold domain-containing protein [Planctomycetota bacterium]
MPCGDSITYDNYSGDIRPSSMRTGYRSHLWYTLQAGGYNVDFVGSIIAGEAVVPAFDPDNEGHGGWTAGQIEAAIYGFLVANPADIILLHIGTNGLTSNPQDVNDILEEIDRYEADYSTHITVLLAKIINRMDYSATTTQFNNNVAAMAQARIAAGDDIVIVDMENGAGINYATDMIDDLHPNDGGYQKMANLWFVYLNDYLGDQNCPDGMIGYWKMDNGESLEDSYAANDLSCTSCAVEIGGLVNGALDFNGTSTALNLPDNGSFDWGQNDSFTIEFWMRRSTVGGSNTNDNEVIVGRDDAATQLHWWVGVRYNGQPTFQLRDKSFNGIDISGPAVDDGQWHHIAAVRDAATGLNRLYVDGVEEVNIVQSYLDSFVSSEPINVGWLNLSPGYYYAGDIDELAISNSALTPAEIARHYTNGLAGESYCYIQTEPEVNIVCPDQITAYWKLDETFGTVYADYYDGHTAAASAAAPAPSVDGIVGTSQSFNGTSNYITVPDAPAFDWGSEDSFTVELWAKFTNVSGKNKVMIGRDQGPGQPHWWLGANVTTGVANFNLRDSNGNGIAVTGTTAINNNQWHHIVAVRDNDANQNRLYIDGSLQASGSHDYTAGFAASTTIGIGYMAYNLTPDYYYAGLLDEIALYTRALTLTEIQQHYSDGLVGLGYCTEITEPFAPIILSTPVTTATAGQPYSYDVSATGYPDPNFYLLTSPTGMTIDEATGLIQWTPSAIGDYNVVVEANNIAGFDQQSFTITVAPFSLRINCGGSTVVDGNITWQSSASYVTGGADYDFGFTSIDTTTNSIAAPVPPLAVYNKVRHQSPHTYTIPQVPNGNYIVRIHWVDKFGPPTVRDIDYDIEGVRVQEDWDIVAEAGGTGIAIDKEYNVTVSDGDGMTIVSSAASPSDAFESAIEITSAVPVPPAITSTPIITARAQRAYTYTVTATGIPAPNFEFVDAPAGMTINTDTGLIQWTPASEGNYDVNVVAFNGVEPNDYQSFTIAVAPPLYLPDGMTHYWKFDDDGAPYEDWAGDNNAVCANCPTPSTGTVDGAMLFDGVSDEVDAPDVNTCEWALDDSFTIEYWMKTSSSTSGNRVIVGRDGTTTGLHWWVGCDDTGKVRFQLQNINTNGAYIGNKGPVLNDGQWHHIVAVRDESSNKNLIYVDANLVDFATHDYAAGFGPDAAPINIGYLNLGGHYRYAGLVDEVAIYNRALTPDEISRHHTEGLTGGYYSAVIAPQITSAPITEAIVGQSYQYNVDSSGFPAPQFSFVDSPNDMDINSVTGLIDWLPLAAGDVNVIVKAENVGGFDTQEFIINVIMPPYIDYYDINTVPFGLKISSEDIIVDYDVNGTATTSAESWYRNGQPLMNLFMPMQGGADYALIDFSDANDPVAMAAYNNPQWLENADGDYGAFNFSYTLENYIDVTGTMPNDVNASYTKTAWICLTADTNTAAGNNILSGEGHRFWCPVDMPTYPQQRLLAAGHVSPWDAVMDSNQLQLNTWYFAAVTYDGSSKVMSLYRDGVMVDTAGNVEPFVYTGGTSMTHIGAYPAAGEDAYFSDMKVNRVRLYDHALSAEQIAILYGQPWMIHSSQTDVNDIWKAYLIPFSSEMVGEIFESNELTIVPGTDEDSDGILGEFDNCPLTYNPDQNDLDADGVGNNCDNCLTTPNPQQFNSDTDALGDKCDNCPQHDNPAQIDTDTDGIGDDCECWAANLDDVDPVNLIDLAMIEQNWGQSGPAIAGDTNYDESVDILDLAQVCEHWLEICL